LPIHLRYVDLRIVVSQAATPSYLEIIDFIASGTTPQAVADYRPSREAQQRVAELIEREKEGAFPWRRNPSWVTSWISSTSCVWQRRALDRS